eukprot:TRINITY_DN7400_c0_g1_i3.p1 TRINITY_DN7400_c0_g1~~TRINITY_DN7400_c0_g1_i3.p1  ORF type:complete len:398 (+),score=45.49 TRINITY_DN7400_c0_g1_i3:65-1258(+)
MCIRDRQSTWGKYYLKNKSLSMLRYIWIVLIQIPLCRSAYVLSIATFPPVVACDISNKDKLNNLSTYDPKSFKGLEVYALRNAFKYLNWTEPDDYYFRCDYIEDYYNDVVAPNGTLDAFFGAWMPLTDYFDVARQGKGFDLLSGISLLYKIRPRGNPLLKVLRLVDWLIIFFFLPALLGFILYFIEEKRESWISYIYGMLTNIFKVSEIVPNKISAKVVNYVYMIVIYIVFDTLLKIQFVKVSRSSKFVATATFADLRGRHVSAYGFDPLTRMLKHYKAHLHMMSYDWELTQMIDFNVNNDKIEFFAIETPVAKEISDERCDFALIMNEIFSSSYVIYHRSNVDESLVRKIDIAVVNNSVYQNQPKLYQQYLEDAKPSRCPDTVSYTHLTLPTIYSV